MKGWRVLCGVMLMCWLWTAQAAPRTVVLWSHYDYPPFVISPAEGLSYRLASTLSRLSGQRFAFVVQVVPRKRLDAQLSEPDWQGVVGWVNPAWFDDLPMRRHAWSAAILNDEDWLLSSPRRPLEWQGPQTLEGLRLGGLLGHRYVEIESLLRAGRIQRDDVSSQEANLRKLAAGRIDAMFMTRSAYLWLRQHQPAMLAGLHVSREPRSRYERRLFANPLDEELAAFIRAAPALLAHDPAWQQVLRDYGLQSG